MGGPEKEFKLNFLALIDAIHAEIAPEYLPEAITWCDRHLDNVWEKAVNRFDAALVLAMERGDYLLAKIEGDFYLRTILDALGAYRKAHHASETDAFVRALRGLSP